jgi:hypothetical protein
VDHRIRTLHGLGKRIGIQHIAFHHADVWVIIQVTRAQGVTVKIVVHHDLVLGNEAMNQGVGYKAGSAGDEIGFTWQNWSLSDFPLDAEKLALFCVRGKFFPQIPSNGTNDDSRVHESPNARNPRPLSPRTSVQPMVTPWTKTLEKALDREILRHQHPVLCRRSSRPHAIANRDAKVCPPRFTPSALLDFVANFSPSLCYHAADETLDVFSQGYGLV